MTYWELNKMVDSFQISFSYVFSWINKISFFYLNFRKFVILGPILNKSLFVQVMAWYRTGDKPSIERMMIQFWCIKPSQLSSMYISPTYSVCEKQTSCIPGELRHKSPSKKVFMRIDFVICYLDILFCVHLKLPSHITWQSVGYKVRDVFQNVLMR